MSYIKVVRRYLSAANSTPSIQTEPTKSPLLKSVHIYTNKNHRHEAVTNFIKIVERTVLKLLSNNVVHICSESAAVRGDSMKKNNLSDFLQTTQQVKLWHQTLGGCTSNCWHFCFWPSEKRSKANDRGWFYSPAWQHTSWGFPCSCCSRWRSLGETPAERDSCRKKNTQSQAVWWCSYTWRDFSVHASILHWWLIVIHPDSSVAAMCIKGPTIYSFTYWVFKFKHRLK